MVLATGALNPTTDCACSELTRVLSFAIGVCSQGYFDAEERWRRTTTQEVSTARNASKIIA